MAKHKIVWSHRAEIQLFTILDFYKVRNGNTQYSSKLYKKFIKSLKLLFKQPDIGITTDFEGVRGLIIDEFILFYEVESSDVRVFAVWDSRQNPEKLKIK